MVNLKHIIDFFHLHIISITLYKDTMPCFDKFVHVCGILFVVYCGTP